MKIRLLLLSVALALLASTAILSTQRSAQNRFDVTTAPLATSPEVSARLAWAARNLAPSGLQKLERMGTSIAPGIAAGTAFPAVRQQAEGRIVSAFAGLSGMDVSEAAFIVLSMATKDMDDDIRLVLAEIKAANAAKQKLRDLIAELNRWVSEEMNKHPGSGDIDNEKVSKGRPARAVQATQKPKPLPMPPIALENATSPVIHVEYLKAPVIPPLPPRDSGPTIQALKLLLDELKAKLDGMNEMSEMTSLRLQMTMDRRSKFISTLSQMMKKDSTTQDILVQNIK
jgi:hypothetical protein